MDHERATPEITVSVPVGFEDETSSNMASHNSEKNNNNNTGSRASRFLGKLKMPRSRSNSNNEQTPQIVSPHSNEPTFASTPPTTPPPLDTLSPALSPTSPQQRSRRLSNLLSNNRSRSKSRSNNARNSIFVPDDLPANDDEQAEALALNNISNLPRDVSQASLTAWNTSNTDTLLQEAIDLHERGDLEQATVKFRHLADPNDGINHPLAQVLYGLSLRHGWGCEKQEQQGFDYLRMAASNSALMEQLDDENNSNSFKSGVRRTSNGGKFAKGEMIIAIYELGNCFRYGWGCEKDQYAAKTFYESAAKLGDPDAMIEVAWCYLHGFGTKKDKFASARYYRQAEENGRIEVGNSWIWKDKYS